MSGTQTKRATARPAMPWFSLCAALVGVGVLLLLQEPPMGAGSQPSRTAGSSAPALRQALFGTEGAGAKGAGAKGAGAEGAGANLVSGASAAAPDEHDAARTAGGGFDAVTDAVSASEAAVSVPSGSLASGEPGSANAVAPAGESAAESAAESAGRPVH